MRSESPKSPHNSHWSGREPRSAKRTNRTCAVAAIADAAFPRICGGGLVATQQISPNQPFRGSKPGKTKLPPHCVVTQHSGRGTEYQFAAPAPTAAFCTLRLLRQTPTVEIGSLIAVVSRCIGFVFRRGLGRSWAASRNVSNIRNSHQPRPV